MHAPLNASRRASSNGIRYDDRNTDFKEVGTSAPDCALGVDPFLRFDSASTAAIPRWQPGSGVLPRYPVATAVGEPERATVRGENADRRRSVRRSISRQSVLLGSLQLVTGPRSRRHKDQGGKSNH